MSSDTISTNHFIVVDGKIVGIPRLTVHQITAACAAITAQREADARSLSTELKLSPNELFNVLFDIRGRKVTASELLSMAKLPGVALDIVARSLGDARKSDFAEVASKIGTPALIELAEALVLDIPLKLPEATEAELKAKAVESPLPAAAGVAAADSTSTPTTVSTGKGSVPIPAAYGSIP